MKRILESVASNPAEGDKLENKEHVNKRLRLGTDNVSSTDHESMHSPSNSSDLNEEANSDLDTAQQVLEQEIFSLARQTFKNNNWQATKKSICSKLDQLQNINAMDQGGKGLIHYAIINNDLDFVKELVEQRGADINLSEHQFGRPPLFRALSLNNVSKEIAEYLVGQGADLEKLDCNNSTILHAAASNKDSSKLEYILTLPEVCELINNKNKFDNTPLEDAVDSCNLENIKLLLSKNPEIRFKTLSRPTYDGELEMINAFIEARVDLLIKSEGNDNLLHSAALGVADKVENHYGVLNHQAVINKLVEIGVSRDDINNDGLTPLGLYQNQVDYNWNNDDDYY